MRGRAIVIAVAAILAAACRTSSSQSSAGTASAEPSAPQGSESTASGERPRAGEEPLMEPGAPVKGHASDRVVSGSIERVSALGIDIVSDRGEVVRLEIVPETSITVNGIDATTLDLEEGQPVRASYNERDGKTVAVEIRASPLPGETPEIVPPGPGSEPPDTGSMGNGSTGAGSSEPPGVYR